jgi:hypothetical protein
MKQAGPGRKGTGEKAKNGTNKISADKAIVDDAFSSPSNVRYVMPDITMLSN